MLPTTGWPLYEKPGKGREFVSCIESGRHHNDIGDALRHIGWMLLNQMMKT